MKIINVNVGSSNKEDLISLGMVTTTAGTVSDPSSNKENRESQNKEDPKNEHSMKANSVDNSKPLPEDKLNSINDGVTQGMSNDQAATNVDSTQNSRSETATTTVSSNVDGSSNGFPEPNSCIPNGPVESFSNVPQPNYQTFTNASSFGGQAGPSVRPSASSYVPSQFSKNHQSSTTPTLNKLLMSPSRYPHNYLNNSNPSSNNHQKPNQGHMQSWDQRTPQEVMMLTYTLILLLLAIKVLLVNEQFSIATDKYHKIARANVNFRHQLLFSNF